MNGSKNFFLFVGNGSYFNRGCEAIVRGTVEILRNSFGDCRFVNANFDVTRSPYMPDESDSDIIHKPIALMKRGTAKWITYQILKRVSHELGNRSYFSCLKTDITRSDAVLSIGGDNYSLDYGIPRRYVNLNNYVLKKNKPLIIWGASVGPFDSDPEFAKVMHQHLKHDVTAIFVREEASLDYLNNYGVSENVFLMADPAFLMKPESVDVSKLGFDFPQDAIGFNLSPLMLNYVGDDNSYDKLNAMAAEAVECLHKKSGREILLIPHVTSPHSNDFHMLKDIQISLKSDVRKHVHLIPSDLNAAETKWIISKLSCLIASRTHATIAGFSTCVPTVSLAYSMKAFGINEKLFGHTDYIVKPEDFSPEYIEGKTQFVLSQEQEIRNKLQEQMEQVRSSALAAGLKLKEIIGR